MATHGCMRSGLLGRSSTRSCLTLPFQLNNLLRQNSWGRKLKELTLFDAENRELDSYI